MPPRVKRGHADERAPLQTEQQTSTGRNVKWRE
jgi:hypothetical protein